MNPVFIDPITKHSAIRCQDVKITERVENRSVGIHNVNSVFVEDGCYIVNMMFAYSQSDAYSVTFLMAGGERIHWLYPTEKEAREEYENIIKTKSQQKKKRSFIEMSYCELKIVRSNIVESVKEFRNSHGGAGYIWDKMYTEYEKDPNNKYDSWLMNADKLWPLWKDERVPEYQQLVMGSTYDGVIIEFDKLPLMADYYDEFVSNFGRDGIVCHLKEWAKLIREIHATEKDCQGVCFHQMSVSEDPWRYARKYIEDNEVEYEYLPYDITKGDEHWLLFENHSHSYDKN